MYSIETSKLTKRFKEKVVVNEIDLKIKQGELFALLGVNGAGKTTTIKMLSGLILPTSGSIKIENMDIKKEVYKIKEILNADESITEVRFSVSCSKTSAHRIYMNGTSNGFRVEANGEWSEIVLTRAEVLNSTGRIYCDDALTASSTIVLSFTNFYAVKTVVAE